MKRSTSEESTNDLLRFIYKNRKVLIITGFIAGVVSIVISLLLPVLYESNAIVYPTETSTVSFNSDRNAKSGSMDFGDEEKAEHLIQILKSSPMRNKIINKFKLAEVYDIDPEGEKFHYKLKQAYDSHINFNRTRYGSVNISVLDKDPELAAKIANKIVVLIDTLKSKLIQDRTVPAFKINIRKLNQLYDEQEKINNELDSLSKLGVVTDESRTELYKAYVNAKKPSDKKYFKNQIEVNLKYGSRYDALSYLRKQKIDKIADQESSYEQAESDATQVLPQKFVVESASASDKKAKPKRAIIVIVFTFSALLLMFIILLIRDKIRAIKLTE